MKKILIGSLLFTFLLSCSRQQYVVTSIQGERFPVVMDENLRPNPQVDNLVDNYKTMLDKTMNQIVGVSDQDMTYGIPESLLTNLTSDVMLKYGKYSLKEGCDLAIMNVNGHRSNLAKGNITLGNIFEIYSFENALTVVKLRGNYLKQVFDTYARIGGYGISSSVRLLIKDKKILEATVDGLPVDNNKIYTIVTLDYLAEGNDHMQALTNAVEVYKTGVTLRDAMLNYVKEETKQGRKINSVLDGRVSIVK